MAVRNTRFTPQRRGPFLKDGTGGTSERKAARQRDPVLQVPGHKTEDIRLTPAGTDVSAGEGDFYDVGNVDLMSVGTYKLVRQDAASATAEPLGDFDYLIFNIYENTAGVFVAEVQSETEGGTATNDAADSHVTGPLTAVADAGLDGAGSDSRITVFVATAADVTDAAAWTAAATLTQGNLYILDAEAAATHVCTLQRIA
jgi:hypothetical protein